jgi:hypothetical protein
MKFFGKKSLSSVMSVLLRIAWYLAIVAAVGAAAAGVAIVFHAQLGSPFASELAKSSAKDLHDWQMFQSLPLGVRILILPYFGAVMALLMIIIWKSRQLFAHFRSDIVFNTGNVRIILGISRLVIVFSIITFSLGSLLVGIILRLLCEIMKSGTTLQEEHDLTI